MIMNLIQKWKKNCILALMYRKRAKEIEVWIFLYRKISCLYRVHSCLIVFFFNFRVETRKFNFWTRKIFVSKHENFVYFVFVFVFGYMDTTRTRNTGFFSCRNVCSCFLFFNASHISYNGSPARVWWQVRTHYCGLIY